jgi:hypothetical protein
MHCHKYGRRKQCIKKLTTNENSNRTPLPGTSGSRKEVIPNALLLGGEALGSGNSDEADSNEDGGGELHGCLRRVCFLHSRVRSKYIQLESGTESVTRVG